ncbi:MAG: universal stress protein, partial [Rhizobacter sp.]|nr:universal stress protein [Rhizobacter sp.]
MNPIPRQAPTEIAPHVDGGHGPPRERCLCWSTDAPVGPRAAKGATMSTSYRRILVPIDGSPTATRGLDEAIGLFRANRGSIRILHVMDDLVFVSGSERGETHAQDVAPRLRTNAEQLPDACRKRAEAVGV